MTFWVAGGTIVGHIGAGLFGANAARKAALAQKRAIRGAKQEAESGYEQQRLLFAPYQQVGNEANNQLSIMLGLVPNTGQQGYGELNKQFSMADFQQDPGYQFRLKEALKTVQRTAASRGGTLSGNTLAAVQGRAQNMASEEYSNAYNRFTDWQNTRYNRLLTQQGVGATTTSNLSSLRGDLASNLMNLTLGQGNVEAQKQQALGSTYGNMFQSVSNAIGGGMADMQNNALQQKNFNTWLDRAYPQGGTGGGMSAYPGQATQVLPTLMNFVKPG